MLLAMRNHLSLRLQNINPDILMDSILPWVYGERFLSDSSKIDAFKKDSLEDPYPQSAQDQLRQISILENFDGRDDLKKIKAPTLVMYGKEDLISLPSDSEFLARHIPQVEIKAFDGGHGILFEDTEKLAESIIDFFLN